MASVQDPFVNSQLLSNAIQQALKNDIEGRVKEIIKPLLKEIVDDAIKDLELVINRQRNPSAMRDELLVIVRDKRGENV